MSMSAIKLVVVGDGAVGKVCVVGTLSASMLISRHLCTDMSTDQLYNRKLAQCRAETLSNANSLS